MQQIGKEPTPDRPLRASSFDRKFRGIVGVLSLALAGLVMIDVGRSVIHSLAYQTGANPLISIAIAGLLVLPGAGLAIAALRDQGERRSALLETILLALTAGLTLLGTAIYWRISYG